MAATVSLVDKTSSAPVCLYFLVSSFFRGALGEHYVNKIGSLFSGNTCKFFTARVIFNATFLMDKFSCLLFDYYV